MEDVYLLISMAGNLKLYFGGFLMHRAIPELV